ncbi:ABC transporter permease [Jidongwangia harbinensis]|uniref:ABC transporter permease n=1 Tax=Jidongwangia harbinensis TaxID=2878561 RepID=UPI001CD9DD0E|nr:ABC transporter permease [Jidongwangia harbinensis]MCA2219060.1 ABC transporter permease [Jidongwangia harbinensis]
MNVFVKMVSSELKLSLREPLLLFFSFAFPTILIVILGSIPSFREPSEEYGGLRTIDLYVPIALALIQAMLGLQSTPQVLATYREKGILRRLATTPAHPMALLGAQLVMSLLTAVASAALVLIVGRFAFDVPFPRYFLLFTLCFMLSAAAVFSVGIFLAAVVPSGKAAAGIGGLLFFPLMFFAGLWVPRQNLPDVLNRIGDFTPLGAGQRAIQEAAAGTWPAAIAVAVLVGYVVVFGLAAAKLFRWE